VRAQGLPALSRPAEGLYDPRFEHDACGVAFVATLTGVPSRTIVDQALTALRNLDHRGASGAEPDSGDGAGILTQVPDAFLREVMPFELPDKGSYAVGTASSAYCRCAFRRGRRRDDNVRTHWRESWHYGALSSAVRGDWRCRWQ